MSDTTYPIGWNKVSLGQILKEVDIRARDYEGDVGINLPVLSLTKNHGLIMQSERFNHRVATEDVSQYKVVKQGWVVYNPYVLWEGAVHALWKYNAGLVSPVYPVWEVVEADAYFVDCLLKTPPLIDNYERACSGVVKRRRSVSKISFQSFNVIVPPLSEQRLIAAALRTIQDAIKTRDREIYAEQELKAALSTFLLKQNANGDSLSNEGNHKILPPHWRTIPLSHCATVQTGVAKGRKLSNGIEVPYLRVANVQDGFLDLSEIKTILIRHTEIDRYRIRSGDVLLTEGGDFDKLGRGFVWRGDIPDCVHQNHVFAVRVNQDCLLPEYFAYLAGSAYGKAYFLSVAHKTTNLACINTTKLKAFPVLVPPLEEQRRIVSTLAACDHKIAGLKTEAALLQELFVAMLEEFMSGGTVSLRVQHLSNTGVSASCSPFQPK